MKVKILAAAALAALAASGSALAADVIDQDQESHPKTLALLSQTDLAQSFEQTADNIAGAGVFLSANGLGPVAITISLWDALPNADGTELAAATDTTYANSHWFDVYWTAVPVTPNKTYYLVFTEAYQTNYGIAGDFTNPYGGGIAYANTGYSSLPALDYAFRTYSDPSYVPPTPPTPPVTGDARAVPEPATWALMILGFGAAGGALRRRRAVACA